MRILIVEDEVELRAAIAQRLRKLGHAVDEAGNARDARLHARMNEHALAILDRMLPDGDALGLVREWREKGRSLPVLMLTARGCVDDRVEGLLAGADDYMVKPFAMDELIARVAAIARRGTQPSPVILRVGDLTLDTARREVMSKGVLIPLRPKEFAFLELLLRNAGRVVTRERIIEACWDEASEPASNVEQVVIASLRRKLGDPALVQTVRGVGYRIKADGRHG